jgi:hypothetical protein
MIGAEVRSAAPEHRAEAYVELSRPACAGRGMYPATLAGSCMADRAQSRAELLAHLADQVGFLNNSAQSFDAGNTAEAKRLAIHLRVLLHDTRQQQSLLQQLGVKDSFAFHDVTGPMPERAKAWIPLAMELSSTGLVYMAKLGPPLRRVPFSEWWPSPVYKSAVPACEFTRKSIVLAVANRDGGAHVDPELEANYATLSRDDFLTTYVGGQPIKGGPGPVPEMIRQMAHEVLQTLNEQPVT